MAERVAASALPRKGRPEAVAVADSEGLPGVLGTRLFAYLIDSAFLFIFSMVFVAAGALFLLIRSDWGERDAPDSAMWGFVLASLAVVPAWALFNLTLLSRRGQSIGQYVTNLRVEREAGGDAGFLRLVLYLLALHPLVFHPLLAAFWALLAYLALSLTTSNVLVLGGLAVALLCVTSPIVAMITSSADGGRRGLHDRIAGTTVVRLE